MDAREAKTFIQRLRQEIKRHVLKEMAASPSGELAQEDLAGLLIAYGNWRGRYVAARPRRVHESRELEDSQKYGEHAAALAAVRADIIAGRDLTPRLSRGVGTVYVATSRRGGLQHRRDLDLLLSDWGIHHLHLGTKMGRNGLVTRTEDVLLIYFTADDAYLIDSRRHPNIDNWAEASIMQTVIRNFPGLAHAWEVTGAIGLSCSISDEERLELRQAGVDVPLEIDGKVYRPVAAGMSLAGTPLADTMHVNALNYRLNVLDTRFSQDPQWLNGHFALDGPSLSDQPVWFPFVHEDVCGALEGETGYFVPFGALRRS